MRYLLIFLICCVSVFAQSTIDEDSIHFIGQASAFTVGANLITGGGDFTDWTGSDPDEVPDDWDAVTAVANEVELQEVGAGAFNDGAGSGACNIYRSGGATYMYVKQNNILTSGKTYRLTVDVSFNSGALQVQNYALGTNYSTMSTDGTKTVYFTAADAGVTFKTSADPTDATIDNVEIVEWVGDLNAGGGCTLVGFKLEGNELLDIMGSEGQVLHHDSGLALADSGGLLLIAAATTWDQTPIIGTFVKCDFSALFADGIYEITNTGASTIEIDLPSTGLGAETVEVWIGGAYPDIATAMNDSTLSQGYVTIPFTGAGAYVMKPGDEIDGDTSGATATILGVTITSGSFVGQDAAGTLRITVPTVASFQAEQIDVAANNDVADVTAAESSTYRKRYICVNVDQEVGAVTDFIAETSETALREDGGSRKIIGFYDSLSVVQPDAGYRIVSDMDQGGIYYGGAWEAFKRDESFTSIRPDGKWTEWNAKGNDINILELNTSNVEMRNLKIHNTIADSTAEGILHIDTANFNTQFVNCWFATSSRFVVDDLVGKGNGVLDCYFEDTIDAMSMSDFRGSYFVGCIIDLGAKANGVATLDDCCLDSCLIYGGEIGINGMANSSVRNTVFFDQTTQCIILTVAVQATSVFINNIFSPAAAADIAIDIENGSLGLGFNNIMYSATAGAVLTNPIVHDQTSPNPPLPVGTLELDPQFVNPADGDFRLRASSPALNGGMRSLFNGYTTIGANAPYSSPNAGYRSRYNFKGHNYSDR